MNKRFLSLLFSIFFVCVYAQQSITRDTITRTATIKETVSGNNIVLTSEKPALNQIAGAPKAFYTHFWEFGDGNTSTEASPSYVFNTVGTYTVELTAFSKKRKEKRC